MANRFYWYFKSVQVRILIMCLFLPQAELLEFKSELVPLAEMARQDGALVTCGVGQARWCVGHRVLLCRLVTFT